ncbi:NEDD4 family-interacting protein 2 [Labeo rohita]|uniref:NEDD4 family-interacting protein 2 n=2 Tax=Labeonini TaxID=2743697 RepID=A0ABQ8LAH4_LABRO|nr:NEDD4 family-interacting protein 2 [Labeo rohita]
MAEENRTDLTLPSELNYNVRENASIAHGGTEKKREKWLVESQGCTAVLFDAEQNVVQIQGEPVKPNDFENAETSATPAKETDVNIGSGNEVQHKDAGDASEEKEPQIEPHDSISNVSLRVSGKKRHRMGSSITNSSSSSKSSTASERIRAEAERAALLACAAALKEKHALEEQEYLLKRKKEQLELETKIAVANAKLTVLQGSSSCSMASKNSDGMESYVKKGSKPKVKPTLLNPHAPPFASQPSQQHVFLQPPQKQAEPLVVKEVASVPSAAYDRHGPACTGDTVSKPFVLQTRSSYVTSPVPPSFTLPTNPTVTQDTSPLQSQNNPTGDLYSVLKQQNDITALLVKMQTAQLLPHREIPTYDGDPLQFNSFMKAFEHCVEAKTSCKGDCLYYLEQYTRGQPRGMVRSCLHMTAEKGYAVAKQLLKEHFGNEFNITAAYMEKVTSWPSIKSEDVKALKAYGLFLHECCNAMEELRYLEELNMPANMKILIQKFPYKLREKWRTKANEILERTGQRARFPHIVDFIEQQIRITSDPVFGVIQDTPPVKGIMRPSNSQMKSQLKRNIFATHVSIKDGYKMVACKDKEDSTKINSSCLYCAQDGHVLEHCHQLGKRAHREKLDFLKEKGLCFGCLNTGHLSKSCDKRITCKHCSQMHPSILHIGQKEKGNQKDMDHLKRSSVSCKPSSTCGHTGAGHHNGILSILPVQVKSSKGTKIIKTYAFLDAGSTDTFCSQKLLHKLNIQGRNAQIHLRTMGHNKTVTTSIIKDLEISGLTGKCFYQLPCVFTQEGMPVSTDNIISEKELAKWPYLKDIKVPHINADVDLLVGTNASKLMEPWEVVNSQADGPYAVKTLLGWVINGSVQGCNDGVTGCPSVHANRTVVDRIEELLTSQYNYDFNKRSATEQEEMSREEKRFLDIMERSAQLENGHYKLQLPFRREDITMPNNISVAMQRILGLKKKLQRNTSFREEYTNFITDAINNGYAEQVPQHQLLATKGKVWYIPHHGVYHPRKHKLRVVFDCGAEYKGVSLNSQLLQGPNLTSSLVGVLMRFRQEHVALMADIKAMFHQVQVTEEHVDYLRFLWWPEGNLEQDLKEHRMTVHLFGAVSSPSCACFALRKTAEDNQTNFSPDVIETVNRNFYMDDLLKSLPLEEDAVAMVKDLITICSRGGFTLTQWISNSREVLQSIPVELRSQTLKELDLAKDELPVDRALGLQWCIEMDSFKFKVKVKEKPSTKRGMLSIISSIYDPLGFLAPLILPAKLLLQELCRMKCDWDDPIPSAFQAKWNKWLTDLEKLANFQINRCIKPDGFGKVACAQLHHFADASEKGYGTATYIRMQSTDKRIHVSFLYGKSRVAPLRPVTIPRLELTAAVVAVRIDKMLQTELQLPLMKACFWTDSASVLKYIRNEDRRFQTFVANRIATIRSSSEVSQWRYVPSTLNPADDASRGTKADGFLKQRWTESPEFLWEPEEKWPKSPLDFSVTADDPELKRNPIINATIINTNATSQLISFFSDWQRLKVAVAWILKLKRALLKLCKKRKELQFASANGAQLLNVTKEMQAFKDSLGNQKLSLKNLTEAETAIVAFCQQERFPDEIAALTSKNPVIPRSSSIYRMDPVLDGGLLHVGGRLSKAAIPEDLKHPLILSKDQHISYLILHHYHLQLGHGGRSHVLSSVRRKFWITNGISAVKRS